MLLFTAVFLLILGGVEVDLFVPSFPDLQSYFSLSTFEVELTVSLNLLVHCLSALIVGNLGDKWGRKPIIILGLSIFVIGSFICCFTTTFPMLLFGRMLQGIGISGPTVLVAVVLTDILSKEKLQNYMGYINSIVALSMACAPILGCYINNYFNWRGNFYALLLLGLVSLCLAKIYLPKEQSNQSLSLSLKEFLPLFKEPRAVHYISAICFGTQSYWVFICMSPILYIENLGVPIEKFGFYQGIIAATFALGSFTNGFFINRFGQFKCFMVASMIVLIFFILTVIITIFQIQNETLITITMMFQAIGMSYPINILLPLAYNEIPEAKSRMGALLTSLRLTLSAITLSIASYFYNGTFFSIGLLIIITLLIATYSCFKLIYSYDIFNKKKFCN